MSKRYKKILGYGMYQFPGGELNKFETIQSCACRGLKEETGIILPPAAFRFEGFTEDFEDLSHRITFYVRCFSNKDPLNLESEKQSDWEWFDLNNLPEETCMPIKKHLGLVDN